MLDIHLSDLIEDDVPDIQLSAWVADEAPDLHKKESSFLIYLKM